MYVPSERAGMVMIYQYESDLCARYMPYLPYWFVEGQDIVWSLLDVFNQLGTGGKHYPSPETGNPEYRRFCLKIIGRLSTCSKRRSIV
jgi:hypothetical protein